MNIAELSAELKKLLTLAEQSEDAEVLAAVKFLQAMTLVITEGKLAETARKFEAIAEGDLLPRPAEIPKTTKH